MNHSTWQATYARIVCSSYQSISRLRKHVNAKQTGTLKYRCDTCDQDFTEKHQLEAYLIKHDGDKVMCSVCDKNFTTTFLLGRHIAGAHENVKHQCRTCKAVFMDKDVLKQHVLGLHDQKYRYVCFCNMVDTFL